MKVDEINDVLELVKMYQPVIKAAVPLIAELGEDIKPLIEMGVDASADFQLRFFNRLINQGGMTREEALLTLNSTISGMVNRSMSK